MIFTLRSANDLTMSQKWALVTLLGYAGVVPAHPSTTARKYLFVHPQHMRKPDLKPPSSTSPSQHGRSLASTRVQGLRRFEEGDVGSQPRATR